MASALSHLFGGGQQSPTIMAAPQAPPQAPPIQQPTGTPSTNKDSISPSFMSAAATPNRQNTSTKSLLGQ